MRHDPNIRRSKNFGLAAGFQYLSHKGDDSDESPFLVGFKYEFLQNKNVAILVTLRV